MTDHSDLIARLRKPAPKFGLEEFDPTYDVRQEAASALSSQSLSLSEAREEIERLTKERDEAIRRRDHTQQWYAERLEPIKDVAKREGVWDEVAAIIANGSGTRQLPDGSYKYEPPTYAQQLNIAKWRAEAAYEALKPFVRAFDGAREKYAKRYGANLEIGYTNFDKMPGDWPMVSLNFSMATFRRASKALENGPAGLADATNDPASSDLSSLRKGAEVVRRDDPFRPAVDVDADDDYYPSREDD